jgi:hypothetical protein
MNLHDAATASAQQCFSTSASAFSIGIFASLNDITSSQCSAHRGQSRRSPGTDSQAPVTAADAAPQHSVDRQSRFWSPGVTTFTANRLLRSASFAACRTATSPCASSCTTLRTTQRIRSLPPRKGYRSLISRRVGRRLRLLQLARCDPGDQHAGCGPAVSGIRRKDSRGSRCPGCFSSRTL